MPLSFVDVYSYAYEKSIILLSVFWLQQTSWRCHWTHSLIFIVVIYALVGYSASATPVHGPPKCA